MTYSIYRLLAAFLSPVWLLYLALRQRGGLRLPDRLGFGKRAAEHPIWIQAVSVGEARIALRLARSLRERGESVLLTSTTSSGLALMEREGKAEFPALAFPLDLPSCWRRFLKRQAPKALVLVETELWPSLLREAKAASLPIFVANARLSDRSLQRFERWRSLWASGMPCMRVAAQDDTHAERFKALGAAAERACVLGNLKYDLEPPAAFEKTVAHLGALLPEPAPPCWAAGSVREGEEEPVLKAHAALRAKMPGARLILAPRHLDRVETCIKVAAARGLATRKRTASGPAEWNVLVLDTFGELWAAYAVAQAAFVGGSLVPLGGQNVLEPAFLGKSVLFGPHTENFRAEAVRVLEAGGGFRVASPEELADRLADLLSHEEAAKEAGARGREAVLAHRGAVERTVEWILRCLEPERREA